jgi:uncharacterized short protein YbdD (DUF466 family)
MREAQHWLLRFMGVVRDILRGATGSDSYERYCAHLASAHPGTPIPSRAEHFRACTEARWHGLRRCC